MKTIDITHLTAEEIAELLNTFCETQTDKSVDALCEYIVELGRDIS